MTDSSQALKNIEDYFGKFRDKVGDLAQSSDTGTCEDVYGRLGRLKDRYLLERGNLTRSERRALSKVFEDDGFIDGLIERRNVSEHSKRPGNYVTRTLSGRPIELTSGSSAYSWFPSQIVNVQDVHGEWHRFDHSKDLEAAKRRIAKAIDRAKQ